MKILITNLLFILSPLGVIAQKEIPPKETIYIFFKKSESNKKTENYDEKGQKGIRFVIKDGDHYIDTFYSYDSVQGTLNKSFCDTLSFMDWKTIGKKEAMYYKKRFNAYPPVPNKDGVFNTFIVESIDNNKIVKYPVTWRNQGVEF